MPTDAQLLASWRAGDERAGEELYRRRVGEISRFFRNKVPEADLADVVSQTFLGVLSSRDEFRGETSFRRFAYAIARNVLLQFIRKRYKREREQLDFSIVCVAGLDRRSPSSIIMRRREIQAFVESLREVPLDDQIILEMRFFEELTGPQIAEALAAPEPTVRGRLARATNRLRKAAGDRLSASGSASAEPPSREQLEDWAAKVREKLRRTES